MTTEQRAYALSVFPTQAARPVLIDLYINRTEEKVLDQKLWVPYTITVNAWRYMPQTTRSGRVAGIYTPNDNEAEQRIAAIWNNTI